MLESLAANVLNRFLGNYVANLEQKQLNIAIWSGDVVLRNLQLKKEALDKFNLPIDVLEGYVGELTLNIPWSNLKNKPVKVFINDVYLLAVPKAESEDDPEEIERRAQQLKQEQLANAELLHTSPEATEDDQKNQSFMTKLVTKIVDNLQISIRNIHIRYEDKLSDPGHPFAAGFTLSEFSAVSTDSDWKPTFIEEETSSINKLITLGSLAIYWNTDSKSLAGSTTKESIEKFTSMIASEQKIPQEHQYILKPVSGTGRITLNKQFEINTPKTTAILLFDELGFILDDEQYREALLMADLFHFYLRQQQYRKFRPPKDVTPKKDPRAWLKFAGECIISEIRERNRKLTWEFFKERRDDRHDYVEFYKDKQLEKITPENATKLEDLERKLSYEDILFYRSIAKSKLKKEREKERALIAKKKKEQQQQALAARKSSGWFSGWWYGGSSADSAENETIWTDEQLQELYEAIEYDESEAVPEAVELPKEWTKLSLKTELKTGSFVLKKNPHGKSTEILSLVFDTVTAKFLQRPDSFQAETTLGSLSVRDGSTEGTLYPQIVRVKEDFITNRPGDISHDESSNNPFFQLVFEHNPLDGRADNALSMKMRHLEIIYNQNAIEAVTEFFKPPDQQLETITALVEAAGDTFEGLKAQTRAVLEMKLEEHKTIDVEVDMNAPIIIVPKSCTQSNTEVIVLDSGYIRVESKLVSKADKEEIQSKANSNYSEADYKRLESLMYDRFSVQLSSTQLLVGQSVDRCLDQIRNSELKYDLHVIDRINLQFLVEMSILPRAPNLTKFRVSGHLPLLKTNFSDRKYKIMMSIIETVTSSSSSPKEEAPKMDSTEKPTFARVANDLLKENKNVKSKGWGERNKHIDNNMIAKLGLGKAQDLVLIDSESSDEEAPEHNEEFYDAQDTGLSNVKMNQRMFEFEFRVDKFTTTLKQADSDPDKPDVVLVDMVLEHFGLTYVLRPFDMSAEVVLKSLSVVDKISDTGSKFKHLAASEGYGNAQSDDSADLVHIKYTKVDKKSPEYMSKFEGISQSVDIEMSTINIIVTRKSILTLYNYVLDTFTTPAAPSSPQSSAETESPILPESQKPQPSQTSTMRVKVKLNSIRFILNNDGVRLATGLLYHANVAVLLLQNTIRVGARLGNFSLTDDMAGSNTDESLRQLLTLQGEDLAVFSYETYDESAPGYPGYDSSVSLSTGSAKLTFLEEPIRLLLDFGSKFAQMKGLYDSARRAAVSQAAQLQEKVSKFHFEISIRSPIIVFPNTKTNDLVIANLGEFSASNEFKLQDGNNNSYLTRITAELQKISLTSNFTIPKTTSPQIHQIINDVDINFNISYADHVEGSGGPDMTIIGKMSDVKMNLTEKQYKFLFDLSNSVSRAFSSPDEQAPTSPNNKITDSTQAPPQSKTPNTPIVVDNSSKIEGEGKWVTIGLVFEVNQIYLEIFTDDGSQERILDETSLSRFSLNQTKVEYKMFSDKSMNAILQIQSVTLSDTRPNIKNIYRDILPAVNLGKPQFLIDFTMSGDPEKSIIALVKFDSPKIILTLDHLFATRNYFMSAFESSPSSNETIPQAQSSDTSPPLKPPRPKVSPTTTQSPMLPPRPVAEQPKQTTSLSYQVEIGSAEIILLANPHLASSEAVVLSAQKMVLVQQSAMVLNVDQVGMFLCQMDKRESTLLSFIDNFNLKLTMSTQSSKPEQQLTDINVEVDPLILRVSYRDVLLIVSIVNKVSELSSQTSSSAPIEQPETTSESSTDNVRPSNTPSRSFNYNTLTTTKKDSNSSKNRLTTVVTRESLKVKLKGARLVLIGDEHDIPMIDGSCDKIDIEVVDWSSQLSVDANVSTYVNYFNLTNSHWEPLIEPWQYSIHALKQSVPESMMIDITSQKRLEINVTHIFVETMLTTLSIINQVSEHLTTTARGSRTPYILRNKTGYDITVWAIASDDAKDTEIKLMNDGQELDWRFDDWRKMREMMHVTKNMLGIQFKGSNWECIKDIPVDREGETLYILRPKKNEVYHRLVVDVKLVNNVKIVTFRSALVVENRTNLTLELLVVDTYGNHVSKVYQIGSGEDCPIPIEAAYYHKFKIRPDGGFGYNWSLQNLYWKDFLKQDPVTSVSCHSIQDNVPFRFKVFSRYQKKNPLVKEYPCMAITLSAPIQIENLLPYDMVFRIIDRTIQQDLSGNRLEKGQVMSLHLIDSDNLLALNIEEISDTVFNKSEWAIINSPNKSDYQIDKTLTITHDESLGLKLRIHYFEIPDSGGAFKISIYSPYVMINKTGLDISFKSKSLFQSAKDAGIASSKQKDQPVAPYMFSYDDDNNQNRALLKVGDSDWSKPLSFEAVGTFLEVVIPSTSTSRAEEIHLGVSIQEGHQKYKLTKIVTFTPRFIIKNNLNNDIIFREPEATNETRVQSKNREPLHFLKQDDVKRLVLRYHDSNSWSAPINIDELGRVHLKLERSDNELDLIRTEVLLEDATVFVIFNKENGDWPFRVENYSDVDVVFYQQETSRREFFGGSSNQQPSSKKYTLKSGNTSPYSWDYPAHKEKRLVLKVNNHERVVNIQEIGSLLPFKCPVNGVPHILAIEVVADGPTQVLLLSNYNQSESLYRPKAPSVTSSNTDNSAFEVIDVDMVITLTFQIRLEGIGISVVNKRMQELAYASVRGLEFTYNDSTLYQSVNFFVKWLQIDNQLYGGIYPIILYPTVIPKDTNDSELVHRAFHASLTKAKDESHGVTYFKYFSMLLQEMTFEIDEDFLFALLDFTKIHGFTSQEPDAPLIADTLDIPEPKTSEGDNQLYFEVLHINPMKINISFVRTERINVENKPAPRNPIMFFFNVLTMAIGNINDAPIKLNALVMENMRVSFPVLIDRIRQHYGEAFIYQVHKIVGSADFLGNPVGLFNNLSSGVVDIFYEPYQGIVMSDRPQDLGIGIARGASSFVKKTVYGFSDSLSKFTGSIGKGLASATLDKTFQDRRRMSQYKNRPKHALYGVAQGANSLVTSIGSGFEGLVRKPIEGVEKEGATGLIKGVGKGIVGFVTKPVVGMFDLASNVSAGIRNTTTVFDENDIVPVRLPRFVGRDGILKPYQQREALGQSWLKQLEDGKYFNDEYVAHLSLMENDEQIIMLTRSRMMLVKIKKRGLKVDWEVPFSDLQAINLQNTGILLTLRGNNAGPFIPIQDRSNKEWFERQVEQVINELNAEKKANVTV
ncbi:vacuolar protein sorting-associated protein 13 [Gigaspora margarita]|uniref:Vacuolar protein sorting-associated protein 13 n=1 Tax=Gigaspora margarita TaxID=4874 RepID=A0A8H4AUX1_GIGMA|nr:vacuolar protein sorting-associated protein 13 [Gigaspora margarita]